MEPLVQLIYIIFIIIFIVYSPKVFELFLKQVKPEWFNESVGLSCWHFKYNMVFDYNFYHETTTIYKQLQCLQNQKSGTNKKVQMKPCSCMTRCGTTVYMTVFSQ